MIIYGFSNSVVDVGVVVAEDIRSKSSVVIDVLASIGVPNPTAFSFEKGDLGLNQSVEGHDTAGNEATIVVKYLLRLDAAGGQYADLLSKASRRLFLK